jgi:hypothetical protein
VEVSGRSAKSALDTVSQVRVAPVQHLGEPVLQQPHSLGWHVLPV